MDSWSQFRILYLTDVSTHRAFDSVHSYVYVWSSDANEKKCKNNGTHAHFERHQQQQQHNHQTNKKQQDKQKLNHFSRVNLFRSFYNLYVWLIECGRWLNTCSVQICSLCIQHQIQSMVANVTHVNLALANWLSEWVSECGKINTHTRIRIVRIFLTHFNCFLFIYFSR